MTEEAKRDTGERMQRWAYAGQRTSDPTTGKLTNVWIVMRVDGKGSFEPTPKEYYFESNIVRKVIGSRQPRIGGLWDVWVETTDKGISVTTSGVHEPQPVHVYDGPEVIEWEIADRAAHALKDARAAGRKLMQGSELADLLAPVRTAYAGAYGAQRAAILAAVIAEITGDARHLPGKPSRGKAKGKK